MTEEKKKQEAVPEARSETTDATDVTTPASPTKKYGGRTKQKKTNQNIPQESFKGDCAALKGYVFVYEELNTKKWINAREKFISYAGTACGGNEKMSLELGKLTIVTAVKPDMPSAEEYKAMDEIEKEFIKQDYTADMRTYKAEEQKTRRNLTRLYEILWKQCNGTMQSKIRASPEYTRVNGRQCVLGLLSIIDVICENGDAGQNRRLLRFLAKKKVYNFRQSDNMDIGQYLDKFEVLVKIAEKAGACFYSQEDVDDVMNAGTIAQQVTPWKFLGEKAQERCKEEARQRALAMIFFMNSNEKYAVYKQDLRNAMNDGEDRYPKTVVEAHTKLEAFRFNPHLYQVQKPGSPTKGSRFNAYQFFMNTEDATDADGEAERPRGSRIPSNWRPKEPYQCHNCDRMNQCLSHNCKHLTKESGEPTRNERKRLQKEKEERTHDKESGHDTAQQHLIDTIDSFGTDEGSWSAELEGDDYEVTFYTDGAVADVLVEDLRGKAKHAFNQCERRLNPKWILFDNCSSINVFYNKRFLRNIRQADRKLHLYTNAGRAIITMVGDLPGFGEVYYYPDGIANILSFHAVTNMKNYTVEYHNGVEDAFKVTNASGDVRKFIPSPKGLYYWDSSQAIEEAASFAELTVEEKAVETIKGNRAKFSARDNNVATKVRALQNVTNWSKSDMIKAAQYGPMLNSPFTPRDVRMTHTILGPSVPGLKGKTTRRKRKEVSAELVPVPKHVMDYYKEIVMSIDVMHVNTIPFLVTISKHIHYGTATVLKDMTAETLFSVIADLDKFYYHRGFKIVMVLADKQFEVLKNELEGIAIATNIAVHDEHVPEVERFIRVIKERCRSAFHNTPFKRIPARMVIGLVNYVLIYINGLPWEGGLSMILSPMTIVTGRKLDYNLHGRVPYGAYAQLRRKTDNTMKSRTFGGIAMGPANNLQGAMTFMRLKTGRKVERDVVDYTILPMPDEVIDRINEMGSTSPDGLVFGDRSDNQSDEDSEDEESLSSDSDGTGIEGAITIDDPNNDEEPNVETEGSSEADEDAASNESTGVDDAEGTGVDDAESTGVEDVETTGVDDDATDSDANENPDDTEETIVFEYPEEEDESNSEPDQVEENIIDDSDEESNDGEKRSGVSGRRIQPYSWKGYEDAFIHLMTTPEQLRRQGVVFSATDLRGKDQSRWEFQFLQTRSNKELSEYCASVVRSGNEQHNYEKTMNFLGSAKECCMDSTTQFIMTQYGLKAGLKEYGEEGKAATNKEMKQMLSREVFEEVEYSTLSNEDKRLALPILLFLTRKRDGSVKGRACADGRKQRIWMSKEDTRSPTVSTEALFYLLMMDAFEERDVATLDLPGHFLQTPMEGRLILRLDGELALALVELDRDRWMKHLKKIRGRWVIFVKCSKAIYGTLNAALLSYNKLIGHLTEWGFTANPYDTCVWNKMVHGKQLTVAFHVDDMKVSHRDPSVVDGVIQQLKEIYGKTDPMTVVRGKIHEYLGMTIDFQFKGEVKISMYDYIQKMINDMPDDMKGEKKTAAPEGLFKTDDAEEASEPLNEEDKEYFHTTTARALYLGKRGRPDLQTAVAFLCTRVRSPNKSDYKKLVHLMQYLQATRHLPLILRYGGGATSLYIDGAHAVHTDMRGHAGVMATGGKGTLYAASTKNKLNTTSSTETEIVSVGEKLPKHIWFRYFRIAQGGDSSEDVLYQDNEAAMLLQNNGRMSCGKGSKHIHIRYFFITDRIRRKEIKVVHCPTKEMIADYYTKPLQGGLFRKFRDRVLGINMNNEWLYKAEYEHAIEQFGLN